MLIAVTYEDGNVFQHFGHTENFKLYEIEDGAVKSSRVMSSDGVGHEALADLLADNAVDVIICGGMGQGAKDALSAAGLEIYAGQAGTADEVVEAYLRGELVDSGVNCDHHDHEHGHDHHHDHDNACGADCGSACGADAGGCSGCPGCGGEPVYLFEGRNVGKNVKVHYIGFLDDGEKFDSSYERKQPLEFVCGTGRMIKGFDRAVAEMEKGDMIDVRIEPADAYGEYDQNMLLTVDKEGLPGSEDLAEGETVMLQDDMGRPYDAVVAAVDDKTITFDFNHPMAGKALNFRIELLDVR